MNSYLSGKSNDGETVRVFFTGNEHINNHHQIVNNYFGPRPRKGGPRAETIRIGDSKTRVSPSFTNVSNNYFEACNGEVEIISDKTNFNTFKNNIFYKCEGSLVLRHGSYATVDGNIFIGGDESNFYGGIRIVNTGHWITNNYFYKIKGEQFRSPLAIMNGIPMTPLNRYLQVSDVVVAYNTWIDCKSPWQIGVGQNLKSADVLPPSEIRSAPPIRTIVANNIIYNTQVDKTPVINHSTMEGILFKNNIIDNASEDRF
ncbi:chondroitinase-B domain-containing protein [Zobellia nedashkovskayae]